MPWFWPDSSGPASWSLGGPRVSGKVIEVPGGRMTLRTRWEVDARTDPVTAIAGRALPDDFLTVSRRAGPAVGTGAAGLVSAGPFRVVAG